MEGRAVGALILHPHFILFSRSSRLFLYHRHPGHKSSYCFCAPATLLSARFLPSHPSYPTMFRLLRTLWAFFAGRRMHMVDTPRPPQLEAPGAAGTLQAAAEAPLPPQPTAVIHVAPSAARIRTSLFPSYIDSVHVKGVWELSVVYITHMRYNILSCPEFRARLSLSQGTNPHVEEFVGSPDSCLAYARFRSFFTPTAAGFYDARALQLYSLLRGGLIGKEAQIEFPTAFDTTKEMVGELAPHGAVVPWFYVLRLQGEEVFNHDGTALCFALCSAYRCRYYLEIYEQRTPEDLYTFIVPVLARIVERLNVMAVAAGYNLWSELVAPSLFFDITDTVMTLYTRGPLSEPHHRISILGPIPGLTHVHINTAFGPPVSAVPPTSGIRAPRLTTIRRVARLFGHIQLEFPHHLSAMAMNNGTIPQPLLNILLDIQNILRESMGQGPSSTLL